MIKDTLLQHKAEKERFLPKNYIVRDNSVSAKEFLKNDMIKVITGPRRAGKSVFSFLLLKDENFAYLNFDDEKLLGIKDYDEIIKAIFEVYPGSKFVFFDEIQNLEKWELFVNKLQRRGYNLILTGSNANLLNKELATVLTGRYIPIEILPFSFKEFLQAKNFQVTPEDTKLPEIKGKMSNYLHEYLKNGGFPEVVVKNLDAGLYLETLFDAVLFKDVVKRYGTRFPQRIYDLALYLLSNVCSEFTFTRLRNVLEFRSTSTVQKYLGYLEESYLFFSLNRFSFKMKEQVKTPKKIYTVDNGFILAKAFQTSANNGKLMENLVLREILRNGYRLNETVFYYKTRNGKEIDFVLKEGLEITALVQVCFDVENIETRNREIKALCEAGEELECNKFLVITWDYDGEEDCKKGKIQYVPLFKWLEEKNGYAAKL